MISKEKYEKLKEEFGQKASWAVWAEGDGKPYIQFVRDLSVFEGPDLLDTLHNNFVVVGLNPSTEISKLKDHEGEWVNYHAGKNDYKLRHAFEGTPIWGAYMTDFYPNHFASTEDKLVVNDKDTNVGVLELKRELEILGGNPILIALGTEAYKQLNKYFSEYYEIYKISNHGRWAPKDSGGIELWKTEVQNILAELDNQKS